MTLWSMNGCASFHFFDTLSTSSGSPTALRVHSWLHQCRQRETSQHWAFKISHRGYLKQLEEKWVFLLQEGVTFVHSEQRAWNNNFGGTLCRQFPHDKGGVAQGDRRIWWYSGGVRCQGRCEATETMTRVYWIVPFQGLAGKRGGRENICYIWGAQDLEGCWGPLTV